MIAAIIDLEKNPEAKEDFKTFQINAWIQDCPSCIICNIEYKDVKNFEIRNPKCGGWIKGKMQLVDNDCWDKFIARSVARSL